MHLISVVEVLGKRPDVGLEGIGLGSEVLGASLLVCDLKQAASYIQVLAYYKVRGAGFFNL